MAEVVNYRLETILYSLNDKERIQYLKEMIEDLKKDEEKNKETINILNEKLLKLEMDNENSTDEELLETMKNTNSDLSKLKLIKTSKFDNDSKRNVTYLYYINEYCETEMLEIEDEISLKNFIVDHQNKEITAKEIYEFYRKHISREVDFDKPEAEQKNTAVVDDDITKNIEYKKVEEYKKDNGIFEDIEVTVDSNGERLYKVGNVVIKFETVADERKLKVLEDGKNMEEEQEQVEQQGPEQEKEIEQNQETSSIDSAERLDYLTKNVEYDISYHEFEEMVEKVLINEEYCDLETHAKIIVFVENLRDVIETKIANDENCEFENKYLDYYMDSIEPYYNNYKEGFETKYKLSEQEILLIEQYKNERKQSYVRKRVDETKM